MATRATALTGKYAKVALGSNKVLGIASYTMDGFTVDTIETTEFGDFVKHYEVGLGDGGTVTLTGVYDPTDANGQQMIVSACKNYAKLTDLRFYVNTVSYLVPDVTNESGSCILITKVDNYTFDKAGVAQVSITGKIVGKMALI